MHYKQNNKETKSYVQGLRPFGNTLPRGIRGILRKNGYNYSEIITKWKILIEKDISDFSYPISIKMSKKGSGAVLLIGVKRGNEITLEYSKKDIINKINSYFGYNFISEIKLKSINSIKKKMVNKNKIKFSKNLDKKINEISNEKIKKSLSDLFRVMKK
jgi:hypothetical protein|tara:strand:+ start:156 stop:632 length:477 start_codon:yes stop_codon:yes gene_type:complete